MSEARLPARLEANALMRRVEADGGFATMMANGDDERGALLLVILGRGRFFGCYERFLRPSGAYEWTRSGPSEQAETPEIRDFLEKRRRNDPDQWQIELDVADPERFVAEMIEIC